MNHFSKKGKSKLAKVSGGRGLYAQIELEVISQGGPKDFHVIEWLADALRVNGQVCRVIPEGERNAVHRGILMALDTHPKSIDRVNIQRVEMTYADTTPDCLTYVTCFAVWDALEICGCTPPRLKDGIFHFPETP